MKLNDIGHLLVGCEASILVNMGIIAGTVAINPAAFIGVMIIIHAIAGIAAAIFLALTAPDAPSASSNRRFAWYIVGLILVCWTLALIIHLVWYTIQIGVERETNHHTNSE